MVNEILQIAYSTVLAGHITTSKATHRPSPNLGLSLSYSYIVTVRLAFMCNVRNGSRSRKNLLQKLGIAYTSRSFD